MAINKWLGTATAVAQVDTFTPGGTIEADDIFILTITGYDGSVEVVSAAAGGTGVSDVTAAMTSAWNNSTGTLASTITAADNTTNLTLTADTAGVAFKVAATTTEAGGGAADAQTFVRAATTANGGPNDWSDANNWSQGTIPGAVASEDTFVEDSAVDILYGLDQSGAANTLTSFHTSITYTGKIGHNGSAGNIGDYLQIKASKVFIGEPFLIGTAPGSNRVKLDLGSTASDVIVYFMATSSDANKPALRILAASASTDIKEIRQGSVGIASQTGETSTINDVLISYENSISTDATLEIGSGVTMEDLNCIGGETQLKCAATTVDCKGGVLVTSGTGTITTLNVKGGQARPASNGTITTCNVTAGTADFTISAEARTVSTLNLSGGLLQYDRDVVTITSKVEPVAGTGRIQYAASQI